MNNEDRDWLLNTFPTFRGRTIRGEVLAAYYRAEMLLNNWDKESKNFIKIMPTEYKLALEKMAKEKITEIIK